MKKLLGKQEGISLPEVIIYSFVTVLVSGAVLFILVSMFNSSSRVFNITDKASSSQVAMIALRDSLRNAKEVGVTEMSDNQRQILAVKGINNNYQYWVFGVDNMIYYKETPNKISINLANFDNTGWSPMLYNAKPYFKKKESDDPKFVEVYTPTKSYEEADIARLVAFAIEAKEDGSKVIIKDAVRLTGPVENIEME